MLDKTDVFKDKKLKHLVVVYPNMKFKQANAVLEALNDGLAFKILSGVCDRTTGEILFNIRADHAAINTEALIKLEVAPVYSTQPGQTQAGNL